MIGIILASHGEFATGILQSGNMIFGEQENVQAVTLHPNDSPDDLKQRMQTAIATFTDCEQILFLVDLWGGTPFNQANNLAQAHHDKWIVISGLNLPMLIEAYGARLTMDNGQDIAKALIQSAQEGIKSTAPQTASSASTTPTTNPQLVKKSNNSGKLNIVLARVDSRLLHGQVATAWTQATHPNRIIVVSDTVSKDKLRKQLIEQAAPPGVKANVVPIKKIIEVAHDPRFSHTNALLLFENPQDVLRAIDGGLEIKVLNIGSMAHSVGKVMVNNVISMDQNDIDTFEKLQTKEVQFDVRKVPNDSQDNMDELLVKAKQSLS
ncbi:MAG: PTS sugar transporter subunit IIB [Candidatus Schmidhempelia sp.]|nr:PTS sugar transporter subunit IIB [Candidatus Schmidhempelia sp.]